MAAEWSAMVTRVNQGVLTSPSTITVTSYRTIVGILLRESLLILATGLNMM
jgi:hypothetical protein